VVSTTAPLMQKWFAETGHPSGKDPYFLYAASNAGSMLTLIAYPSVIEPFQGLTFQGNSWMFGYAGLAVLTFVCGRMVLRGPAALAEAAGEGLGSLKLPANPSSEQIKEQAPSVESITTKPTTEETAGGDNGSASASASGNGPEAASSEA